MDQFLIEECGTGVFSHKEKRRRSVWCGPGEAYAFGLAESVSKTPSAVWVECVQVMVLKDDGTKRVVMEYYV